MKILVTGSAGFIGSALTLKLLERGDEVIGIDNFNDYYDPKLKRDRYERHRKHPNYSHHHVDLENYLQMIDVFIDEKPERVVNLAAQAGVRYSMVNPKSYIDSNIAGFANVLECCRKFNIEHLVYASSSSVYGKNESEPFSVHDNVDHPVSLYAASKKANELMAHTYSHLYGIPTTGLRYFTVYGPWDRPDMALQKFTKAMIAGEAINVFNHGNHWRDFTYIDDIVEGTMRVLDKPAESNINWDGLCPDPASSDAPYRLYNIGSHRPVILIDYIETLEKALGIEAEKIMLPLQPGDVSSTYADVEQLIHDFDYQPLTKLEDGISNFVEWYINYYED